MAGAAKDYPYRSFRFRLEVGGIEMAGFSECTGLETEVQVEEFEEGGRNTNALKFPKTAKMSDVTLKHGLTESTELWEWHKSVIAGLFNHANKRPADVNADISKNFAIKLLDESGEEAKRWKIKRPLPIKWTGPELRAADNALAFETLVIAHEGLETVK